MAELSNTWRNWCAGRLSLLVAVKDKILETWSEASMKCLKAASTIRTGHIGCWPCSPTSPIAYAILVPITSQMICCFSSLVNAAGLMSLPAIVILPPSATFTRQSRMRIEQPKLEARKIVPRSFSHVMYPAAVRLLPLCCLNGGRLIAPLDRFLGDGGGCKRGLIITIVIIRRRLASRFLLCRRFGRCRGGWYGISHLIGWYGISHLIIIGAGRGRRCVGNPSSAGWGGPDAWVGCFLGRQPRFPHEVSSRKFCH